MAEFITISISSVGRSIVITVEFNKIVPIAKINVNAKALIFVRRKGNRNLILG
jgi:hypothetical protein